MFRGRSPRRTLSPSFAPAAQKSCHFAADFRRRACKGTRRGCNSDGRLIKEPYKSAARPVLMGKERAGTLIVILLSDVQTRAQSRALIVLRAPNAALSSNRSRRPRHVPPAPGFSSAVHSTVKLLRRSLRRATRESRPGFH